MQTHFECDNNSEYIRLPCYKTGGIHNYKKLERWVDIHRNLSLSLKQGLDEGTVMIAILEDLKGNNLHAINIKIICVGPNVVCGLMSNPIQRVFYQAYFKID